MEKLAKEAEELSSYTMNSAIVSDTEEWHKRKSISSKNHGETSKFMYKTSCFQKLIIRIQIFV